MARGKKKEELSLEERLEQALVPVDEQPYEVPKNWCWTRIKEICEFERGITFPAPAKENEETENNIACLRTANIQDELEIYDLIYVNKCFMKNNDSKLVRKDDIIMSSANSRELVGKTSYVHDVANSMTFGGFLLNIRAKGVLSKYLFYMLRFEFLAGRFRGESTQTTNIANINTTTLGNYYFPLPPLLEQQRIVKQIESLFVKLDEAKEKAQAVVDGFELWKSAILHKAFRGELTERWRKEHGLGLDSWEKTNIGSISDVKGGKRVPKGMSLTTDDTGHPYIKAGNLKLGTVLDEGILFVPDDVLQHIKNYTVNAGDVYITNVGACIGDCGIIPDKYDGANFTENAVKMTNLKCNSQFLAWYISSIDVQQEIKNLIASATLGKLSIANIKTISVLLPTSGEQAEIVRILKNLQMRGEQAKSSVESILDQIDSMKKTILARAFRGELGTNDPAEESAVEMLKKVL